LCWVQAAHCDMLLWLLVSLLLLVRLCLCTASSGHLRQLGALDVHRRLSWLLHRRLGLCLLQLLVLRLALDIVDVAVLVLRLGIHAGRSCRGCRMRVRPAVIEAWGPARQWGVVRVRGYCGGSCFPRFPQHRRKWQMALTQHLPRRQNSTSPAQQIAAPALLAARRPAKPWPTPA
jgi:hypothetical protein